MSNKKGGLSSFLLGTRIVFNNSVTRLLLKTLSHEIECSDKKRRAILYRALEIYSGAGTPTCAVERFATYIIKGILKFLLFLANGDENELKKSFKDPAIRRGVVVVLEGLALYGVTVPQKLPAPFVVVWNFTNMCNLRCKHCYQRADRPLPNELSLEEKINVIDQLDKSGIPSIAFSGGEPTIHPDFLKMVHEAASRGMYVSVATNGIRFADYKFAKLAKEAGLRYVEVSIDSADPAKHDRFRGVKGAWEKAIEGVKNAVKLGFSTGIAVTLTRENIDEIEDLVALADDLGVNRIIFFNFIPVGRGIQHIDELELDPIEREKALRRIAKENMKRKLEVLSTAPYYSRVVLEVSRGSMSSPTHFYCGPDKIIKAIAEYIGGCGAGRIYCALQPDGTVTPCVFMPIPVGNIREKPFWRIWNQSRVMKDLRDREKLRGGFCSKCPYKYICGGCRARAYAYTGDYLAPDPGCILNLNVWKEIESTKVWTSMYAEPSKTKIFLKS